jgi:hypothetical protein
LAFVFVFPTHHKFFSSPLIVWAKCWKLRPIFHPPSTSPNTSWPGSHQELSSCVDLRPSFLSFELNGYCGDISFSLPSCIHVLFSDKTRVTMLQNPKVLR